MRSIANETAIFFILFFPKLDVNSYIKRLIVYVYLVRCFSIYHFSNTPVFIVTVYMQKLMQTVLIFSDFIFYTVAALKTAASLGLLCCTKTGGLKARRIIKIKTFVIF
jgi:hypothetical protein